VASACKPDHLEEAKVSVAAWIFGQQCAQSETGPRAGATEQAPERRASIKVVLMYQRDVETERVRPHRASAASSRALRALGKRPSASRLSLQIRGRLHRFLLCQGDKAERDSEDDCFDHSANGDEWRGCG